MKKINRILLVDDDELFNFIHTEILKNLDVTERIDVAVNGKDALRFFTGNNEEIPEIVLLDIDMPIMNGFEFLHELHSNYQHVIKKTCFIMLTSSFNQRDKDKAKEYNVKGYLNKPLTVESFMDILKNMALNS